MLVLLLICYSEFIPINHEIFETIIPLIITITSKPTEDMMNIGKSFLFRVLNRFVKIKANIISIANVPVVRNYE